MNKNIKYALFFTSGVTVGLGVCGIKVLNYALNDDHISEAIKHKISDKIDKALYGDIPKRNYGRVSYRRYYDERYKPHLHRVDDILYATREGASQVLDRLDEIIDEYGYARVADLHELSGVTTYYTSNAYGWSSTKGFEIKNAEGGYKLIVPQAVPIK